MKTTTHREAQSLLSIHRNVYGDTTLDNWLAEHPTTPRWIAERIVAGKRRATIRKAAREAGPRADRMNTQHLHRDYRPGIGSGRTADWLDVGFRHYAVTAHLVHEELGFTREDVRRITRVLHSETMSNTALLMLPACPVEPKPWANGYDESFERGMAKAQAAGQYGGEPLTGESAEHVIRWRLYRRWHVARAIGADDARRLLARLEVDSAAKVSGYLVSSIASWRRGESGYEGCSGYEHACWLKQHPEHWDLILGHAPTGAKGDGWEQTFPHEQDRAARLRKAGWVETFRMDDSIWTSKHPIAGEIASAL